jgi:hypothetical protein
MPSPKYTDIKALTKTNDDAIRTLTEDKLGISSAMYNLRCRVGLKDP